ncbi:MAG: hypothetical protein KF774_12790 [Planctomyces sp.]|nr:hypothetical protein [Planctomyces sp.]
MSERESGAVVLLLGLTLAYRKWSAPWIPILLVSDVIAIAALTAIVIVLGRLSRRR